MKSAKNDEFPQRQNPASGVHIHAGQSNIVLLTIATESREPWLNNETAHQLLRQTWTESQAWLVGALPADARSSAFVLRAQRLECCH